MREACAHTAVSRVQLSALRLSRRDAGSQSARFRGVLRLRVAAEIATAGRPDEAHHRVSVDRSAELGQAQLPDAFPAERWDDSGKELVGPDALEIFDPGAERPPDAAHPKLEKFPSPCPLPPLDWLLLDAVLAARRVSEPPLLEQRPASPPLDALSDVRLSKEPQMELQQCAQERRSVQRRLVLSSFPLERAREKPAQQALRAMAQLPASAQPRLAPPGPGAQSLLWLPRSSQLQLQLPRQPDQGNVSALARRARCQSSSSAFSSL